MEYLDKLFREYLNEDGVIYIAGAEFYRDEILNTLDQSGYGEAFLEWCSQRRADNIKKADDILYQYDLSDRFIKIKEIHSKGMLIPFIGAGLSIPSGYLGWTEFIYKVLNETSVDPLLMDDLITQGNYEEAAQLLADALPEGGFLEQVENKFGIEKEISGVVQKIPSIFQSTVVTTNFDNVIERCYDNESFYFNEILLGPEAKILPRILGEGKNVLLKLHGKANTSRNRVLTKKEYDIHYGENQALEQIIECVTQNSLLFIGCSLTVDRTIKCLRNIVSRRGHENIPRHYAFLQLNDESTRIKRQSELGQANIYPIWYTGDHDECLEALLEKLADGAVK
ncbi:TPA: SIR2 family protein [Citrobacter braakii]